MYNQQLVAFCHGIDWHLDLFKNTELKNELCKIYFALLQTKKATEI